MAAELKHFYSPALVKRIADSLSLGRAFVSAATEGLEQKELMDRARHITAAMHAHLPPRYEDALKIVVASTVETSGSMGAFVYLPHVFFVSTYGLDHFALSMQAQHALTQKFTCEWSIRPFIERYTDETLAQLMRWTKDDSPAVRRLCSEGTRLRLPWGARVPSLEKRPQDIVALLERLRDDDDEVVRRSVANNLNDLGRFFPKQQLQTATAWLNDDRRALLEHALRSQVKAGDRAVLKLLGFGATPKISLSDVRCDPSRVKIGGSTRLSFQLTNRAKQPASLLVDAAVHFIKANGKPQAKVFKLSRVELAPGESVTLGKTISLKVHTTRKPYPGAHRVEVLVNGTPFDAGTFWVTKS